MPQDKGPLLSQLVGDAEISELFSDEADIAVILQFEIALAEAEAVAGLISADAAMAVKKAATNFVPDWQALGAGLARDGVVVPALLAQLRAKMPDNHKPALHLGATSQDAIDTSLIMRLGKLIPLLEQRIGTCEQVLDRRLKADGQKQLMAHTRMRSAMPFSVADKIATWLGPLARHRASLDAIREKLLVVQFGGPTGTRAELSGKGALVAEEMAKRLGLGTGPAWHTDRDRIVAFGGLLARISGSLGKIGADIALMAQDEVGAIILSGGGGSSSMPHKVNPVAAEVLVSLARHSAGLQGLLQQSMVHENERSGSAWTLEWMVLPQIAIDAGASLRLMASLLDQIRFATIDPA